MIRLVLVPKATPPVQPSMSSWDDEFEPSDVATTVVEATLADVYLFAFEVVFLFIFLFHV